MSIYDTFFKTSKLAEDVLIPQVLKPHDTHKVFLDILQHMILLAETPQRAAELSRIIPMYVVVRLSPLLP